MLQGSQKQMHDWVARAEAKAGWARQTRTLVLHHASEVQLPLCRPKACQTTLTSRTAALAEVEEI